MKRSRKGLYSTLNLKKKLNAVENFRAISKKKSYRSKRSNCRNRLRGPKSAHGPVVGPRCFKPMVSITVHRKIEREHGTNIDFGDHGTSFGDHEITQ